MTAPRPPSLEFYVPYGELLRVFLDQTSITSTEMRTILRGRGIFLRDYEKSTAVPLLSFATVTPDEFADLLEGQKIKDDAHKTVHSVVSWTSARTVEEAISQVGPLRDLIEAHQTFKITNFSEPRKVNGDSEHYVVDFDLSKHDFHKSWISDTAPHSGQVTIRKIGTGAEAKISITSTIPETKDVCRNIIKNIKKGFRANGDVSNQQSEKSVQFSSFDNSERVKFLLSLTRTDSAELVFDAITDSEIAPDKSTELPNEIKPLLDKVKQMSLKGDGLQDSLLLKDAKYHKHIILSGIVIKYRFDYQAAKGSCTISFRFSGYPRNQSSLGDFEVGHNLLSIDEASKGVDRNAIKRYIQTLVDDLAFLRGQEFAKLPALAPLNPSDAKPTTKRERRLPQGVKTKAEGSV
jgi:hypothetical protein